MPKLIRYRLTARQVAQAREPGVYLDGGGLRLKVREGGAKHWFLRVAVAGKTRDYGLGAYPAVSLEQARKKAEALREPAKAGKPPTPGRDATFRQAFESFYAIKQPTLSNAKHAAQWRSTMEVYAFPVIEDRPVSDISASEIIAILQPIWNAVPETARRVLQRIEAVFRSAILRGQRTAASPCIGITQELGTKHRRVEHHASMPYAEVPTFVATLRAGPRTVTRLAMEFLILTAARSGEVRSARWSEVAGSEWLASERSVRGKKRYTTPLTPRCQELLAEARRLNPDSELIFPGSASKPLSDMTLLKYMRDQGLEAVPHGFRASFRTWAAETGVRREVAEAALGHALKDRVEAAYQRSTYLEERRGVMQAWARFIG